MLREQHWQTYRFDQIAENVNVRVDDPSEADVDIYVGLEHLDPESLKIRRWGSPDDVEATKLRFWPGDIIFGRRRFYQRKLAVAEFEGICSAHAMVLRAREDVVVPEFLPFFMQSETFYERAMAISVGSLSPTINWSALARQKFALPPKEEQRRIADILWAVEDARTNYEAALFRLDETKQTILTRLTTKGLRLTSLVKTKIGDIPSHWDVITVGDALEICQYGTSDRASDEGQYPIFRMMNIEDGVIIENDMKYIDLPSDEFDKYRLEPGDILFNRTNSADLVGKVGIFRLHGEYVYASYLIRLRVNPDMMLPEYLNYYLNSDEGQRRILRYATAGVSQSNINASNLQRVLVPLPPLSEQQEIVAKLSEIDSRKEDLHSHLRVIDALKRSLQDSLLGVEVQYV